MKRLVINGLLAIAITAGVVSVELGTFGNSTTSVSAAPKWCDPTPSKPTPVSAGKVPNPCKVSS